MPKRVSIYIIKIEVILVLFGNIDNMVNEICLETHVVD